MGYKFLINTLNSFGYKIEEIRDNIEFVSHEDAYNNIQYNHSIDDTENIKADMLLAFLLSGVKYDNKVILENIDNIIDIFPNFNNVLNQLNIKLND